MNIEYSFVIPLYNEQDSLAELHTKLLEAIKENQINTYQIIFVDDGSTDNSLNVINQLIKSDPNIICIKLKKNYGKADALAAGFQHAKGEIIVTMDADLQDEASELSKLIVKLDEGYDLVCTWKQHRQDTLYKVVFSRIFNFLIYCSTGVKLRDINSGFKLYKRKTTENLKLYGEMHRFIPIFAAQEGYKLAEVPVVHNPRKHGHSKYGFSKYFKGLIDLLTVVLLTKFSNRPGHFFGGIGLFFAGLGALGMVFFVIIWTMGIRPIGTRPLFLINLFTLVFAFQFIFFGVLAELIINQKHEKNMDKQIDEVIDSSVF